MVLLWPSGDKAKDIVTYHWYKVFNYSTFFQIFVNSKTLINLYTFSHGRVL